jgi:hypothetical protein
MSNNKPSYNEMALVPSFLALFGIIVFLFLSWWIGALMVLGGVIWHFMSVAVQRQEFDLQAEREYDRLTDEEFLARVEREQAYKSKSGK